MKKITPQTKDITTQNIDQIAQLFPQVITEKEDANGNIIKAIDFESLKQHLSTELVEGSDERYRLDWPGKRASILKANTPINSTLKPDRESSVNFDTTENLYIEGDNFEVLKILQESYLGKIKMIYIDPPYNTGKDFVYKDNFKVSKEDYETEIGTEDEEGGKLFKNTDTNGRFHSDWLSMMYERLLVARDLLTDDGVIFMSIDDNEIHNLRKIADEVFGEENFIEQFNWFRSATPPNLSKKSKKNLEYILCYEKNRSNVKFKGIKKISKSDDPITKPQNSLKDLLFPIGAINVKKEDGIVKKGTYGTDRFPNELLNDMVVKNGTNTNPVTFRNKFIWLQEKLDSEIEKKTIINFSKNGVISYKKSDYDEEVPPNLINDSVGVNTTEDAGTKFDVLMGERFFDYPKPVDLVKYLINMNINYNDLILDFFSGSASTAHAVMQLNIEDGGCRKFIMAQIPEETDKESKAYKAGYKTIPEIGKERIRRAGKKILEENAEKLKERQAPLDIGFRVYKTAESILKDVAKHPNEVTQTTLFESQDNIKENATDEDILTSVILDFGEKLDNPIVTKTIAGSEVFIVDTNALIACFSKNIDMQVVDEIAKMQPLRAVFRDACFKDDKDLINTVESRFKQLAPNTKVHVI